jgi:hypothetical protein
MKQIMVAFTIIDRLKFGFKIYKCSSSEEYSKFMDWKNEYENYNKTVIVSRDYVKDNLENFYAYDNYRTFFEWIIEYNNHYMYCELIEIDDKNYYITNIIIVSKNYVKDHIKQFYDYETHKRIDEFYVVNYNSSKIYMPDKLYCKKYKKGY